MASVNAALKDNYNRIPSVTENSYFIVVVL